MKRRRPGVLDWAGALAGPGAVLECRKARAYANLQDVRACRCRVLQAPPVELRRVAKNYKNPKYTVATVRDAALGRLVPLPLPS
eukprot:12208246-Alexandrium_andersonii.AAC.1